MSRDALVSCITRWLPVLDEPELRAVEGFVLELVIAARENAIDLSARVPGFTAPPAGGVRADAFQGEARGAASEDSSTSTPSIRNPEPASACEPAPPIGSLTPRGWCRCSHEAGDSDCPVHPTCEGCGASLEHATSWTCSEMHRCCTACFKAWQDDSSVIDDPDATTPRRRFDVSDLGADQ